MQGLGRANRVLSRGLARLLEQWLNDFGRELTAAAGAAGKAASATRARGRHRDSNLDRIRQAVGRKGARVKDIALRTGIASSNVSNLITKHPDVFLKSQARGGLVQLKSP